MFNKVVLVGNLTRDIELRYAQSGSAIANTAIATSRKFTQNGERKEEVCFIDITFFGRSAEVANQYLRRGSKILVEGRLNFDQWVAQDGSKRSKHSVIVETMQMLDSKADAAQGGGYDAPAQQNSQGAASTQSQQSYAQPQQQQAYGQQNSYGNAQQSQQRQEMPQHNIPVIDIDEDEIPF
jgi:single-strand DNA-binding protein